MQSTNWASEHSDALREYLAKGMSFAEIADAINARFKTAYSRSAAIGRSRRMGFAGPDRAKDLPKHWPAPSKLRCVEIDPRHLSLTDLEPDDCRYPYGGEEESEAITFCGHPRRQGSSYCAPHFHLTRGPGTASERAAGSVLLRLVERHETRKPSHDEGGHHKAAAASPSHRAFA